MRRSYFNKDVYILLISCDVLRGSDCACTTAVSADASPPFKCSMMSALGAALLAGTITPPLKCSMSALTSALSADAPLFLVFVISEALCCCSVAILSATKRPFSSPLSHGNTCESAKNDLPIDTPTCRDSPHNTLPKN